jgi:hypothetical protein
MVMVRKARGESWNTHLDQLSALLTEVQRVASQPKEPPCKVWRISPSLGTGGKNSLIKLKEDKVGLGQKR